MNKFVIKQKSDGKFVSDNRDEDGILATDTLVDADLFDTQLEAEDHVAWLIGWSITPAVGPNVHLADNEVLEVHEIEVSYTVKRIVRTFEPVAI